MADDCAWCGRPADDLAIAGHAMDDCHGLEAEARASAVVDLLSAITQWGGDECMACGLGIDPDEGRCTVQSCVVGRAWAVAT